MDEDRFWGLVADVRRESADDTELTARLLFRRLRELDGAEVVDFVRLWERARGVFASWPLVDAFCLLLGEVDPEDLSNIEDWLISHGRETVESVVRNPDDLAGLVADAGTARASWFSEFLTEAHIYGSGTWPLGFDPDGPDGPEGRQRDLSDRAAVERDYPKLAALQRPDPGLSGGRM